VAGCFNNNDDSGSTSSDSSDASTASNDTDDDDNDDNANDQDKALQNNPFAVLTNDDDEDNDAGSNDDADADSGADSEEHDDGDENSIEEDNTNAGSSHEACDNDLEYDSAPDDDDNSTADFTAAEHDDDRIVEDIIPGNRSADSKDTDDMPPLYEQTARTAHEMCNIEIDGRNPIIDVDSSTGHTTQSTTQNVMFAQTAQRPLMINPTTWEDQFGESLGISFTQYTTMKKGLKLFGNKGIKAIRKEMQQFEDLDVGEPINPQDLSMELSEFPPLWL
jgi:hypothetical protein